MNIKNINEYIQLSETVMHLINAQIIIINTG